MIIRKQILNRLLNKQVDYNKCIPLIRKFSSKIGANHILLNQMASPVVKVKQGKLRGLIGLNHSGESYFKFLGIPYAEPPRRFQVSMFSVI